MDLNNRIEERWVDGKLVRWSVGVCCLCGGRVALSGNVFGRSEAANGVGGDADGPDLVWSTGHLEHRLQQHLLLQSAECECVHTVLYYRYHTLPLYLYKEWLLLKELIFIWVQFTIRIDPFCLQKRNRKCTRIERSARAPVLNLIASCAIALNPSVVISSSTCSVRQQNGLCKSCYT